MDTGEEDLALETLLDTRPDVAPELSEELLRRCYAIQKKHQFNDDPHSRRRLMERLINDIVEAKK